MIAPMENKPLIIPDSKKWKGLKVFCYECGQTVGNICKESGKPITQCKHGDKHIYKVVVHVPGTKNGRRTKKLDTRDLNEAIKQSIEFEREAKSSEYQEKKKSKLVEEKPKQSVENHRPVLVIHAAARYIGWLNGEGVPAHEKRERSQEHIKDVERAMKLLILCLKENKYDMNTLEVSEISNDTVGKVFAFLEKKGYSARTFNKVIGYYTSFMSWYANEYDLPIRNYFERIKRKNLNPKPEAITENEFDALLEKVTTENGLKEYQNGVKPERNLYRPWLKHGFRLALETGRRREEIINMRWSDIKESEGSRYIIIEDFKVNRIQNRTKPEEKKYVYVPITNSLENLLDEMEQDTYKETNNFILAPLVNISRKKVMADLLSKGFSHFYKQLNTGRALTFKCLRKTYITRLEIFLGHGNTKAITGHSDDKVIEKNYLDKRELAIAAKNFQVFRNKGQRENNLRDIRETSKTKSKHLNK